MALAYFLTACVVLHVCSITFVSGTILVLTNNGPAVLGGNITFYAVLEQYSFQDNLQYNFTDGTRQFEMHGKGRNASLNALFSSELYKKGSYNMSVSVTKLDGSAIAFNSSVFSLTEDLIGQIIVIRDALNNSQPVDEVAVSENITISVDFHDPNGYLANAELTYKWSIDFDPLDGEAENITYNYKRPGSSIIVANVWAKLPDNSLIFGMFHKKINMKVPVNSVNVSGNPFIHHGEILLLNISCNGSSPFYYCTRFFDANATADNFTCGSLIASTTCNFHVQHYFRKSEIYYTGILISNEVKVVKRFIKVVVYNVTKKPQLSTVIIPIVCTLLTLIIIAGGVAYRVQQRNQLAIEVANFDFQDETETMERTFFEKVYDSFICNPCAWRRLDEYDDNSLSEEHEPLLTSLPSSRGVLT